MNPHGIREHIVKTASELMYVNGYEATSIEEIVKRSSITIDDFFDEFESKEAFCLEHLNDINKTFLIAISDFLNKKPLGYKRVIGVFDYLEKQYDIHKFSSCWFARSITGTTKEGLLIKTAIEKHKSNFLIFLEKLVSTNKPDLSELESHLLSKQLYVLYEGAILESIMHSQKWPVATAKALCEHIVR